MLIFPEGVSDVVVDHNEIVGNNSDDWEPRIKDCGCSGGGKFWNTNGAVVTNNWVHDNRSVGLWADTDNVGFRFEGNYISDNDAEALFHEISYNALIRNNTFIRNTLVKGKAFAARQDPFPVAAVYLSESGGDARVGATYATLEIDHNYFENNWSGITLWENADRFCNSPANTSSGYCTLVPGATLAKCSDGSIANSPYRDDCRWKTQNVAVHDNEFHLDMAAIGCNGFYCARNAVLSNSGSYPAWSPFKGSVVSDAVTFHQNNRFYGNSYFGNWQFTVFDTSRLVDWPTWRAAPYGQDDGSTKN